MLTVLLIVPLLGVLGVAINLIINQRNTVLGIFLTNLTISLVLCIILLFLFVGTVFCEGIEEIPVLQEFRDLHLTENLKAAKIALNGLSGIYAFKCLTSGAYYIGSAVELSNRIMDHITDNGSNIHLQNAIAKYGLPCFIFFVIEFCNPAQLLEREQYYLDLLFSLPIKFRYNIAKIAEATFTGLKHSEETRQRIHEAQLKNKNHIFGKKHLEKSKILISVAKQGAKNPMFGKVGPRLGLPAPNAMVIYIYSASDGSLVQTFSSQTAAAQWLKVPRSTVQNYLHSGKCFQGLYYIRSTFL